MLDKAVRDHLGRQLRSIYGAVKERDRNRLCAVVDAPPRETSDKKAERL